MRIDTTSGLHGTLINYVNYAIYNAGEPELGGRAIVLRDEYPFPERPYSVHTLYEIPGVGLAAENGSYDLTLPEALAKIGNI